MKIHKRNVLSKDENAHDKWCCLNIKYHMRNVKSEDENAHE